MALEQIIWFNRLSMNDVARVGGKNASLGEMISQLTGMGVKVPNGFATTAAAFQQFLQENNLVQRIKKALDSLDIEDVNALAAIGKSIRQWIMDAPFNAEFEQQIKINYQQLSGGDTQFAVAVRSSATAEDLPEASFAGQQETLLNVRGIDNVLQAIKLVFASLFNDRAIAYRVHHNFDHHDVSLSAGIQQMVRSDLAASGVMFTLDTESGFDDVVFITSAYGLGEMVVQGAVNPDEFYVHKPTLKKNKFAVVRRNLGSKHLKMIYSHDTDKMVETVAVTEQESLKFSLIDPEITALAQQAMIIEKHYGRPMDIEWAKDGRDGQLYIVQARPETVKSRESKKIIERFQLKQTSEILAQGRSIGQKIGQGRAKIIRDISQMDQIQPGDVLVTDMTDPDWEPIMKRASAIVTNRGGRTCHAAIIARELGIPAVVGCGDATKTIRNDSEVTVSCAQGETGFIYNGILPFEVKNLDVGNLPQLPLKIMMNVGNPELAFNFTSLPNEGVGLARLEFLINRMIGIHPKALLRLSSLDNALQTEIKKRIAAYDSPTEFYVEKLREGIASLAAAFYPKPVIVRLSDFKSNEYANLLGGKQFEPHEENPMLGFRGASRYVSDEFKACFALECEAVKRVRNQMGLTNVQVMIPFVRTVSEAERVISILSDNGLRRGENELKIIMMCEIPSNALLAEEFLQYFDGFSIGSNDLTQLTLGLDRDSGLVAEQFDERNEAVKKLLSMAIQACRKQNKYIGICGQGPSDHPDFAKWLMEQGIESVSLNPDSVLETFLYLAK